MAKNNKALVEEVAEVESDEVIDLESQEESTPRKASKKPIAWFMLITYIIALAAAVVLLIAPHYAGSFRLGKLTMQAVNELFGTTFNFNIVLLGKYRLFTYSTSAFFEGLSPISVTQIALLVLDASIIVGVVVLLVSLFSLRKYSDNVFNRKPKLLAAISVVESFILLSITAILADALYAGTLNQYDKKTLTIAMIVVCAFVVWCMILFQTLRYRGAVGLYKSLRYIVSAVGIALIFGAASIITLPTVSFLSSGVIESMSAMEILISRSSITEIFVACYICIFLANFLFDTCALAIDSNTYGETDERYEHSINKSMASSSVLRHTIEVLFCIVAIACAYLYSQIGIILAILACISLVKLIASIIRFNYAKKKITLWASKEDVATAEEEEVEENEETEEEESEEVEETAEEDSEEIEEVEETTQEPAKQEENQEKPRKIDPSVASRADKYNNDYFLLSLNRKLANEFDDLFLSSRNRSRVSFLPKYELGGDNSKFFKECFVNLDKTMNIVSDSLLNAMYDELDNQR